MRRVSAILTRLAASPEALALDLADVKRQRRLPPGPSSLDDLLETWIIAATEHFQEQTGRQCIETSFELRLDGPPPDRFLELPRPPLRSVQSVGYYDGSDWIDFDASSYTVIAPTGTHCAPGRILLNSGASWPTPIEQPGGFRVLFTAGYGTSAADMPGLVKATLMFLVGHFHKYGEEVVGGPEANSLTTLPLGATAMITAFKYTALSTQRPWDVTWLD